MRRVEAIMPGAKKVSRRRPRAKPLLDRSKLRFAGWFVAVAIWGFAGWQVWDSGWIQEGGGRATDRFVTLSTLIGFKVEQITVEGRQETSQDDLRAALRLDRGTPIFGFDAAAAHDRLKKLPWVRAAVIERHLPDVVTLRITERRPIALWQRDGQFSLIDTEGVVIPIDDIGRFGKLIVVVGADAPPHAKGLVDFLAAEPALLPRVRAAVRVGDRRWDLYLDDSMHVLMPEEDAGSAWRKLADLERSGDLFAHNYSIIDLRLKDRVVVRKAPPEAKPADPKQRNT